MGISLAGSNPARSVILEHVSILRATSSFEYEGNARARLAQSVEHQTFNLRVAGSSPSSGDENFENRKIENRVVLHGDLRKWTNKIFLGCLGAKPHCSCWEITF